jgi:SpoVK/Ycf46/Vps4 family AAA+-type ATPase
MARASEAQARKLNLSLKLLAHARGQNEDRGRDILKEMIITADVFSRVMREKLPSTQRDEIVREVTLAYSFPKKDMRIIRAIVDYWLTRVHSG